MGILGEGKTQGCPHSGKCISRRQPAIGTTLSSAGQGNLVFKKRANSGERHPSHVDHQNVNTFKEAWGGVNFRLDVPGKTIDVDMNDFEKIDYDKIIKQITD